MSAETTILVVGWGFIGLVVLGVVVSLIQMGSGVLAGPTVIQTGNVAGGNITGTQRVVRPSRPPPGPPPPIPRPGTPVKISTVACIYCATVRPAMDIKCPACGANESKVVATPTSSR